MNGHTWFFWALASAFFAALTAIFAKAGLQGIDSDFATFIRTLVILAALALFLTWAGKWQGVAAFTARNWLFLVLSGLATGASWLAYFKALQLGDASRVAPVDKFSLVLVALLAVVFLGERPRPHEWGGLGLVAAGAGNQALSACSKEFEQALKARQLAFCGETLRLRRTFKDAVV